MSVWGMRVFTTRPLFFCLQMSVSSRRSLPMTRHLSVKSADRISVQGIGVVPTPDHQINVMSKVPHSLIEDSSFTQDEIYR